MIQNKHVYVCVCEECLAAPHSVGVRSEHRTLGRRLDWLSPVGYNG